QRTAHPVALMLRIDDDHIDLPHRVLWVDPGADPTDDRSGSHGDINVIRGFVEHLRQVSSLPGLPAIRPEVVVDEPGDGVSHAFKDRRPGAARQFERIRPVRHPVGLDPQSIAVVVVGVHAVPSGWTLRRGSANRLRTTRASWFDGRYIHDSSSPP